MKITFLSYVLALLVMGALGLTVVHYSQATGSSTQDDELKKSQQKKKHFPTAEYDEPDLKDPQKDQLRKEKQKRHNDFKFVTSKPPEWQTECVFIGEGAMNFPALPVAKSAYILLGKVTTAEAHLSEDKQNVYSEFNVSVEKVFKTANSSVVEGSEVSLDRIGGYVKYPNGRSVLYRFVLTNMPVINERYLFFLVSKNNQDFSILTAYALTSGGVSPLDDSPQFEELRGLTEQSLIEKLRDVLSSIIRNPNVLMTSVISLDIEPELETLTEHNLAAGPMM
jgi:hypothetical protein